MIPDVTIYAGEPLFLDSTPLLPVLAVSPTYHHVDADLSAPDNTGLSGGRIAFYTSYGLGATPVSVEADGGWGNNGGAGGAGGMVELRFPSGDLTLTDVRANGGPALGIPSQAQGGTGGVGGASWCRDRMWTSRTSKLTEGTAVKGPEERRALSMEGLAAQAAKAGAEWRYLEMREDLRTPNMSATVAQAERAALAIWRRAGTWRKRRNGGKRGLVLVNGQSQPGLVGGIGGAGGQRSDSRRQGD